MLGPDTCDHLLPLIHPSASLEDIASKSAVEVGRVIVLSVPATIVGSLFVDGVGVGGVITVVAGFTITET